MLNFSTTTDEAIEHLQRFPKGTKLMFRVEHVSSVTCGESADELQVRPTRTIFDEPAAELTLIVRADSY
jgi:hypothetical protein